MAKEYYSFGEMRQLVNEQEEGLIKTFKVSIQALFEVLDEERYELLLNVVKNIDGWGGVNVLFDEEAGGISYKKLGDQLCVCIGEIQLWLEEYVNDDQLWSLVKFNRARLWMITEVYKWIGSPYCFDGDRRVIGNFARDVLKLYVHFLISILVNNSKVLCYEI